MSRPTDHDYQRPTVTRTADVIQLINDGWHLYREEQHLLPWLQRDAEWRHVWLNAFNAAKRKLNMYPIGCADSGHIEWVRP